MVAAGTSGRIVVGVSASLSGLAALRLAVAESRRRGLTEVTAVRTWPDTHPGRRPPPWAHELAQASTAAIDAAVTAAFVVPPADVAFTKRTPRGQPGPVLVSLVDDTDLIVLGTRRWRLLGLGVAGYCGRHAPCPVIVVPPPALATLGLTRRFTRSFDRELRHIVTDQQP
jgi:nucleotide-binding universal stress UspA family protein